MLKFEGHFADADRGRKRAAQSPQDDTTVSKVVNPDHLLTRLYLLIELGLNIFEGGGTVEVVVKDPLDFLPAESRRFSSELIMEAVVSTIPSRLLNFCNVALTLSQKR